MCDELTVDAPPPPPPPRSAGLAVESNFMYLLASSGMGLYIHSVTHITQAQRQDTNLSSILLHTWREPGDSRAFSSSSSFFCSLSLSCSRKLMSPSHTVNLLRHCWSSWSECRSCGEGRMRVREGKLGGDGEYATCRLRVVISWVSFTLSL